MRRPGVRLDDLADLVEHLPDGCPLWVAWGGPRAWSAEVDMLAVAEYDLRTLAWLQSADGEKGRNRPKPIEPPTDFLARRHAEDRDARRLAAQRELKSQRAQRTTPPRTTPREV